MEALLAQTNEQTVRVQEFALYGMCEEQVGEFADISYLVFLAGLEELKR